jgi:hypothetical protein
LNVAPRPRSARASSESVCSTNRCTRSLARKAHRPTRPRVTQSNPRARPARARPRVCAALPGAATRSLEAQNHSGNSHFGRLIIGACFGDRRRWLRARLQLERDDREDDEPQRQRIHHLRCVRHGTPDAWAAAAARHRMRMRCVALRCARTHAAPERGCPEARPAGAQGPSGTRWDRHTNVGAAHGRRRCARRTVARWHAIWCARCAVRAACFGALRDCVGAPSTCGCGACARSGSCAPALHRADALST